MVEGEKGMTISRKGFIIVVILALAAICAFVLFRYILVSEEDRIRKVIYQGKEAIEQEDLEGVMTQISRYYRDEYGLNYLAVRGVFQRVFKEFDDINIRIEGMTIEIADNGEGTVDLITWATAQGPDKIRYIVGGSHEPCEVIITLDKERGSWRVNSTKGIRTEELFW